VNFFDDITLSHLLRNYNRYRSAILRHCDPNEDLFFILYPFYKTSVVLAKILNGTNLIIWCKSDYVGQFGLEDEGPVRNLLQRVTKPVLSLGYRKLTERLFADNLVFYSGGILYDTDNHRTQHSVIEVHSLNDDPDRVTEELTGNVAFVGHESRQKGLDVALAALERVDRDLTFNIIGLDELKQFDGEGVPGLKLHGPIYDDNKFWATLAGNDVLLMPSIAEKQGKVQLEAMSAGVVPICSDSGGIPLTVENYYNGLLFEERSATELGRRIEQLYDNPDVYRELQANGLETTSEMSLEREMDQVESIIRTHFRLEQ
jgi:glycosyltransferase involved in cell wall biosynthesis